MDKDTHLSKSASRLAPPSLALEKSKAIAHKLLKYHFCSHIQTCRSSNAQCRILPEILSLLKLYERSELVNISQLFHSFPQTRLLTVEFSQAKPKLDPKTSKMTL